jgi:6-phosphogluconolactonase
MKAYIGTYSNSIYSVEFTPDTGELNNPTPICQTNNPSFISLSSDKKYLYAVQEYESGAVSSFKINQENNQLELLNSQPTNGGHPCYISLDKTNEWLMTANYTGGNITVFPILPDGTIGQSADQINFQNDENNPTYAHPHTVVHEPNGDWIFVTDCGHNNIHIYKLNNTGRLTSHSTTTLPDGTGPRHLAFHKNNQIIYSVNETNLTVSTFQYDSSKGTVEEIQTISALLGTRNEGDSAADIHIHPNGKFLYSSNRGQDSISIFKIKEDFTLELIANHPSGGKTPRNFTIDPTGEWLLVANQNSNNIQNFKIDHETGLLSDQNNIEIPAPSCIVFND